MTDGKARLVRGIVNLRDEDRPSVVTIGNYDGVHLGHQLVLEQTVNRARELNAKSCAMTFEPTPQEFFRGSDAPARLSTAIEKYQLLAQAGVDLNLVVRFNAATAAMSANEFVRKFLVDGLGAAAVIVGDDFRFGKGREGDFEFLAKAGRKYGYRAEQVDAHMFGDVRYSSTAVRDALAAGEFTTARALLGRPYTMSGRVVRGEQLGRTLGFATANVRPRRRVLPLEGIFAVRASAEGMLDGHPGVASLGTRPTVGGSGHLLEVHLFDFQGNLYGRRLEVEFVAWLRNEERFDNVDEMTKQMHIDAERARAALAGEGQE